MYSIFCEYCAVGTSANLGINLFSLQSVPLGRLVKPGLANAISSGLELVNPPLAETPTELYILCRWGDLNSHSLRNTPLKRTCMPISPQRLNNS